jgi:hypothetical protein
MKRGSDATCVHFRGIQRDKCEAGVCLRELVGGSDFGWAARLPCIEQDRERANEIVACAEYRAPTAEEIAATEAEHAAAMQRMRTVLNAIAPWRKAHKGESFAEIVECPACKGRLHLSIARSNGHVHGRCATKGCVSWME